MNKNTGQWDLSCVAGILPTYILSLIRSIPVITCPSIPDKMVYRASKTGIPKVKDVYSHLITTHSHVDPLWRKLWHSHRSQKLKLFLWLLAHKKLLVRDYLSKIGLAINPECPLCHLHDETLDHLFVDCPITAQVWMKIQDSWNITMPLMQISLHGIIHTCSLLLMNDVLPWSVFYPYILWNIWIARNNAFFNHMSFDVDQVLRLAYSQAYEHWLFVEKPKLMVLNPKHTVFIKWLSPHFSFFKLNCDGASSFDSYLAGAGGVIRDESGFFVAAFAHHLYSNSSATAEIWAIRDGLLLALKMNITHLIIDSDSTSAIDFCNSTVSPPCYLEGLLSNITS